MKTAADILLILLLSGIFGFIHSFLASNKIKRNIAEKAGNKIAFYRLFYNFVSVISFVALLEVCPKPDIIIYELKPPYDLVMFGLQALSLFGLIAAAAAMDLKEFTGIAQVKRYFEGTYKIEDLDAGQTLDTRGLHSISRHPVYLFSILFLGFRPYMDLFCLVLFITASAYFFIGAYYEEKKLIEKFGVEYLQYRKRVSKIIPLKFNFKGDKNEFASS